MKARCILAAAFLSWAWPLTAAWAGCPIQLRDVTKENGERVTLGIVPGLKLLLFYSLKRPRW
jgi:hypothetical protein